MNTSSYNVDFEQSFFVVDRGATVRRVLDQKLFKVAGFSGKQEVVEQGLATHLAGLDAKVNPYPKNSDRFNWFSLGFGKLFI